MTACDSDGRPDWRVRLAAAKFLHSLGGDDVDEPEDLNPEDPLEGAVFYEVDTKETLERTVAKNGRKDPIIVMDEEKTRAVLPAVKGATSNRIIFVVPESMAPWGTDVGQRGNTAYDRPVPQGIESDMLDVPD